MVTFEKPSRMEGIKAYGEVSPNTKILLEWIMSAYGFILPFRVLITSKEFAEQIKEIYSQEEIHNRFAVKFLESL